MALLFFHLSVEDGEDKEGEVTGSQQSAAMEGSQGDMGVDCPCGCNEVMTRSYYFS